MASDIIRKKDLLDNPDPRVPVCLCLDTSTSMRSTINGKTRIQLLQEGLEELYDAIYEDEDARYAAEFCIVTFDNVATKLMDFSRVEYGNVRENPPKLTANGMTVMGDGLNMALDLLEKRKEQYKGKAVDYYQPWLVLITDGEDNGDADSMRRARERIHELVAQKKLCIYPFHVGRDKGFAALKDLSPAQEPMNIGANQMKGMFKWLSKSVVKVSCSRLGVNTEIVLTPGEVSSWDKNLD